MKYFLVILTSIFSLSSFSHSNTSTTLPDSSKWTELSNSSQLMSKLKKRVKKFHWDSSLFNDVGLAQKGHTVNGNPLLYYSCGNPNSNNRSLILSAVHGDEITPVYYGFRLVEWLKARKESICEDNFVVVAPIVNPDGFLRYRSGTRTNYNKVDLNRNFGTPSWDKLASKLWEDRYKKRRRYFPGDHPDSEPETKFQKWLISEFKPHKILSIHAPLNFLDYDGPDSDLEKEFGKSYMQSCKELKYEIMAATPDLKYYSYGTFPGSLGNYSGKVLGIPTLTAELPTTQGRKAGSYFALLEQGTRTFIEFKVKTTKLAWSSDRKMAKTDEEKD
ncbi:MAG: M14 family zinc carboxypeptidase [Bdellovibrionales bacterium]